MTGLQLAYLEIVQTTEYFIAEKRYLREESSSKIVRFSESHKSSGLSVFGELSY